MSPDRTGCQAPQHGTPRAYIAEGCRCADAREASRVYRNWLDLQPAAHVDITGTRRRIRALQSLGWPLAELSNRLGRTRHSSAGHNVVDNRWRLCTREFADRVAALYADLSMTPGPSPIARRRAERKGWPTPLDWETTDIDDPNAQPVPAEHEPDERRAAVQYWLQRGVTDSAAIARLLETTPEQVRLDRRALTNRRWRNRTTEGNR